MKKEIILDGQNDREIYLVRHGERMDFNEKKEWDSEWPKRAANLGLEQEDAPLTERGHAQARKTAELISRNVKNVYTSPFLRCVQTAEAISKSLGCELIRTADLTEWMNPEWFGRDDYGFFEKRHLTTFPPIFAPGLPKIPESWTEAMERMNAILDNLRIQDDDFFPICVVTHGWLIHHAVNTVNPGSMDGKIVDYANCYRISI